MNKETAIFHYDLRMYFYPVRRKPTQTLPSKSAVKLSFTSRVVKAHSVSNPCWFTNTDILLSLA